MLTTVRFLELLALGLWLGGMVFFSFIVAPAAFALLPSRELAGNLVGLVLARLYVLSYICGGAYLLCLVIEQRLTGGSRRALVLPLGVVVVMLLLTLFNQYPLGERLFSLRSEMKAAFGSIDQTPAEHALRLRFNRYHRVSVLLMSANLLLALGLLALTGRRLR